MIVVCIFSVLACICIYFVIGFFVIGIINYDKIGEEIVGSNESFAMATAGLILQDDSGMYAWGMALWPIVLGALLSYYICFKHINNYLTKKIRQNHECQASNSGKN